MNWLDEKPTEWKETMDFFFILRWHPTPIFLSFLFSRIECFVVYMETSINLKEVGVLLIIYYVNVWVREDKATPPLEFDKPQRHSLFEFVNSTDASLLPQARLNKPNHPENLVKYSYWCIFIVYIHFDFLWKDPANICNLVVFRLRMVWTRKLKRATYSYKLSVKFQFIILL